MHACLGCLPVNLPPGWRPCSLPLILTKPQHQKLGVYQSLQGFRWRPLADEDLLWAPRIQWAVVALDREGGLPLRKKTRYVYGLEKRCPSRSWLLGRSVGRSVD